MSERSSLRQKLRRALPRWGRWSAPAEEHPTPEVLAAYAADELPPDQDEAIQEHFLRCRECPELLLDLKEFAVPVPGEPDRLSDTGVASAWQSLRSRLAREPRPPEAPRPAPRRRWLFSLRTAYALSALLLVTTVALTAWVARLRGELRRLDAPQANLQVATLATATRGGGAAFNIDMPRGAERFLLVLATAVDVSPEGYRIAVFRKDGREIWSQGGLARGDDGSFSLELSRRFLAIGEYLIRISAIEGGQERTLGEYPIRLSDR
jgi:hypothetical protein